MFNNKLGILAGLAAMFAMSGESRKGRAYKPTEDIIKRPFNHKGHKLFIFDTGFEVYALNWKNARRKHEAWKKENSK